MPDPIPSPTTGNAGGTPLTDGTTVSSGKEPDATGRPPSVDVRRLQVRLADPDDEREQAVICDLFHNGQLEGQLREGDVGEDVTNLREGYFSDDGESAFWVACLDEQIIGMVGVRRSRDDVAGIRRLRVAHAFRRQGVGGELLRTAVNFCRDRGYLKIILDVRVERAPAIALFKQFGLSPGRAREIGGHRTLDFYLDLYSDGDS